MYISYTWKGELWLRKSELLLSFAATNKYSLLIRDHHQHPPVYILKSSLPAIRWHCCRLALSVSTNQYHAIFFLPHFQVLRATTYLPLSLSLSPLVSFSENFLKAELLETSYSSPRMVSAFLNKVLWVCKAETLGFSALLSQQLLQVLDTGWLASHGIFFWGGISSSSKFLCSYNSYHIDYQNNK